MSNAGFFLPELPKTLLTAGKSAFRPVTRGSQYETAQSVLKNARKEIETEGFQLSKGIAWAETKDTKDASRIPPLKINPEMARKIQLEKEAERTKLKELKEKEEASRLHAINLQILKKGGYTPPLRGKAVWSSSEDSSSADASRSPSP